MSGNSGLDGVNATECKEAKGEMEIKSHVSVNGGTPLSAQVTCKRSAVRPRFTSVEVRVNL